MAETVVRALRAPEAQAVRVVAAVATAAAS
jgi:hypothetical protein